MIRLIFNNTPIAVYRTINTRHIQKVSTVSKKSTQTFLLLNEEAYLKLFLHSFRQ